MDVVKEELCLGVEGYWEAVRVCNEEHRWMGWHDTFQGASLAMGGLEVYVGAQSLVWRSDQMLLDSAL